MKKLVLAGFALGASMASAFAADLPTRKGPPPAPMLVEAPYNWSGFYVGLNGGYAWGAGRDDISLRNTIGGVVVTTGGLDPRGAFGGGQVGYNWQFQQFVIGAEADFQGAGIRDSFTRTIDAAGDVLNAKMNINYFGTLRGRLGFAFDRALIYATGGLAYADVNETLFVSNPAVAANANLTNNSVKFGGAIGGGVEYALTGNWSVKAEYQYIALAKASGLAAPVVPAGGGTIVSNAISDSFHTVRLGANYKF